MAVADMNNIIEFYNNPLLKSSFRKPQNDLPRKNNQVTFVNSFVNQPGRLHNKPNPTSKHNNRQERSTTITQGHYLAPQYKDGTNELQGTARECFKKELF